MATIKRINLTSGVLDRLLADDVFKREFPFFRNPPRSRRSCKCRSQPVDYNAIKRHIAGLADSRKLVFKEMLGASQVILQYRKPDGTVQSLVF